MNILITSINNKVSLVKKFKEAATKYPDVLIFSGDINKDVSASLFSDKHLILPRDNDPNFITKIKDLCIENNIKAIVNTRDEELKIFASHREELQKIDCLLLSSSLKTLEICQDKLNFFKFCKKNNINTVETFLDLSDIKYPAFSKPARGSGSEGLIKLNSKKDLLNVPKKNIIQEYIDWDEYSIDVFCDLEGKVISAVPRKRIKIINGESHIGETEKNKDIINSCVDLAQKLNLVGHSVFQCFYKDKKVKFIEVNPRYGGASNLSLQSGPNTADFLIKLLKGFELNSQIGVFEDQLKMYRYSSDVFVSKSESSKTYCIDIDGTICTEGEEYEKAKPIQKVINKINLLYEKNTIILNTARGYSSGKNWRPLTEKQLEEWGVRYHKLNMLKPYADYYIDNKAINILEWV